MLDYEKIGSRLAELRREKVGHNGKKGLTQKEVAEMIGVAETSYKAWENGAFVKRTVTGEDGRQRRINTDKRKPVNIGASYVIALADLYGVSCDYILGRTDYRSIDGADVARITGLSDQAIRSLEWHCGGGNPMMNTLSRDVSQLVADWEKNGENSLLHVLAKYAQCAPGTIARVTPCGGGLSSLGMVDMDMNAALLYGVAAAAERFKADYLQGQGSAE